MPSWHSFPDSFTRIYTLVHVTDMKLTWLSGDFNDMWRPTEVKMPENFPPAQNSKSSCLWLTKSREMFSTLQSVCFCFKNCNKNFVLMSFTTCLRTILIWHQSADMSSVQDNKIWWRADLDVSPGDWQDGAGAPGGGADGAERAAGVDRLHGNHRVARQERCKVAFPDEEQMNVMRTYCRVSAFKFSFSWRHYFT